MAKTDETHRTGKTEKKADGVWETAKTIFWALLIAVAFRSFLYQPFSIPSGSMKPTLLVGDYLFVSKFSYGYSRYSFPFSPDWFSGRIWGSMPKRGDVIVFKKPGRDACSEGPVDMAVNLFESVIGNASRRPSDCVDYVKRLIGLPGDKIQVKGGILYINGKEAPTKPDGYFTEPEIPLGDPPSLPRCVNTPVPLDGKCKKEMYLETLPNGVVHPVLNFEGVIGQPSPPGIFNMDNTPVYTVPPGKLFFMGDNRDNSLDSRADLGFVPVENLIGKAEIIAFSADGPFWEIWNWRWNRFFKLIK